MIEQSTEIIILFKYDFSSCFSLITDQSCDVMGIYQICHICRRPGNQLTLTCRCKWGIKGELQWRADYSTGSVLCNLPRLKAIVTIFKCFKVTRIILRLLSRFSGNPFKCETSPRNNALTWLVYWAWWETQSLPPSCPQTECVKVSVWAVPPSHSDN